jgi:uncharacterized Zn finger protein
MSEGKRPPTPERENLRVRSRRGPIGRTWWSARWTAVLESIGLGDRLHRGRSLARSGSVLSFALGSGEVLAEVKGHRQEAHCVRIAMTPIGPQAWKRLQAILSRRAIFAARLLAGEMPPPIEEAFAEAGHSLFPGSAEELEVECDCADPARPCPHVAAVFYLMAEKFDEDPFRIFLFRGRDRTALLEGLKQRRGETEAKRERAAPAHEAEAGSSQTEPADESMCASFWDLSGDLSPLDPRITPPAISEAVLRRLGPPPGTVAGSTADEVLRSAYRLASAWAMKLALSDNAQEEG